MRGLIAYDSYFGNGAQVAAAIVEELRAAGHDVDLVGLHHDRAAARAVAPKAEFLVLGGPTRMKHMSRRTRSFAKKLDPKVWSGRPALVYDTYGPLDPNPAKNEGSKWLLPGRSRRAAAAAWGAWFGRGPRGVALPGGGDEGAARGGCPRRGTRRGAQLCRAPEQRRPNCLKWVRLLPREHQPCDPRRRLFCIAGMACEKACQGDRGSTMREALADDLLLGRAPQPCSCMVDTGGTGRRQLQLGSRLEHEPGLSSGRGASRGRDRTHR